LTNDAVLQELKVTDAQKAALKKVAEDVNKQRQEAFSGFRNAFGGGGRNRGGNNNGGNNAAGNNTAGNNGGNNANPGGFGGNFTPPNPEQMQAMREQMQAAMAKMEKATDKAYASVLKPDQIQRLKEIELQQQGPRAVMRPDIADKLNIGPDQMEQLQQVQNESRAQMGQMFQAMRGAGGFGGPGGRGGGLAGINPQQFRRPDGTFDRDAMKAEMEKPENKAKIDEARAAAEKARAQMDAQREQIDNQVNKEISRVLTKGQKTKFNKMLGKPFDLTKLDTGRGGPGGRNGQGATQKADAEKTDAEKADATTGGTTKANGTNGTAGTETKAKSGTSSKKKTSKTKARKSAA